MTVAPLPLVYAEYRTETPLGRGGGGGQRTMCPASLTLDPPYVLRLGGQRSKAELAAAASFTGGVRLHWTMGLGSARKTAK